jgi:glucokinase
VELAAEMYPARWRQGMPIRELVTAMLADDADALEVAAAAGRWMGRGVALLMDAFNPQVIVFGSLGVALGERVLGPAREVIAREALPQAVAACELVTSRFGAGIGDVASLMAGIVGQGLGS